MLEARGWHLVDAEFATSEQPAMSGDHIAIAIDQDRDIEAKHADAFGNLLDLFLAVSARVCRVRFKLGSRAKDDLQASLVVLRFNSALPASTPSMKSTNHFGSQCQPSVPV